MHHTFTNKLASPAERRTFAIKDTVCSFWKIERDNIQFWLGDLKSSEIYLYIKSIFC